jgi:PAS domain S-box-containing protein
MPDDLPASGRPPSELEHILLQALLQHLPDHIYFKDRTSRFLRVNAALARWAGFEDPAALVGKSDFDLFTVEHASPAFADEQTIIATEQPILDAVEQETWPDGRVSWVATTKLPLRDLAGAIIGTFGVSRDITARKLAEERLRKLTRAVDQCPVSIVITDAAGVIEYANPYFAKTTGYSLGEVVGQNPRVLKSGRHPAEFYRQMWSTLSAGAEWTGELRNRRKDGTLFWERATISGVRDDSGRISHFIAVKEDITARKAAEEEHRALQAELDLAHKQESIGRLSAGVAHEINTPAQFVADNLRFLATSWHDLRRYLAAVEDLRTRLAPLPEFKADLAALDEVAGEIELPFLQEELPRCLEQSLEGMARMARIVGALKAFAHPPASGQALSDLAALAQTVLDVSRHEWKYVAEVVTEFAPDLPPVPVVVDEFNQALLNLVINAAHAIRDALAQRGETKGRITVRTRLQGDFAALEIEDTGVGIPESIRPHLFEPFVSTKGAAVASGQGLHSVHNIVRRHGGRIEYDTAPGRGTTFRLLLPLARTAPSGGGSGPTPDIQSPPSPS